ncbi:SIR2 family protein [Paenibacillus kyungheensis]|uniref:SIR2 family protein n=1 Tax=Paenibacillus kyungheensis TaxID=1452732 RepID=A0AAX3M3N3_9BACL|nr:SIR2 family protein [Paenibacillus kyungheensis]WCT56771.1 SIR2 family protein [Paenibacillus kyungheensis]
MKIYDAAILALKELNTPSTPLEILEIVKKNGWYSFNTQNEIGVLTQAIRRHMKGYAGVQASEKKFFLQQGNKYTLINQQAQSLVVPKETIQPNWKMARQDYIMQIKNAFQRDQLSLFLGAGVSTSAGFPTWNALLEKLNDAVIEQMHNRKFGGKLSSEIVNKDDKKVMSNLLASLRDESPIINAFFLESTINSHVSLAKHIRHALYGKNSRKRTFTSETLSWLAKLCNHRGKYRIRSVVTFNYDDLLEQHLSRVPVDFMTVFKEDDEINPVLLPVFHVHGYLPQHNSEFDESSDNLIVFSEQAYHTVYTDAYSWSNITQMHVLKENICLFIGLSMNDPNMRRILDIAARRNLKKVKHYALMQRLDLEDVSEDLKKLKNQISKELLNSFLEDFHFSRERLFAEFGIRIVWFEDHEEIPDILKLIVK